ncbi:HigA family addiction module antitoxin [Methylobacterium trifolii]
MTTEYETDTILPPMHPGEVLREAFMVPLNLTAYAIAEACAVPHTRIERIAREEIGLAADMAFRLGRHFGIDPQGGLNLQGRFDLLTARNAVGAQVDAIRPLERDAA